VEQREAAKEAKVNMQLLATAASKGEKAIKKGTEKASKEASGKNRSDKEKASQKTKEGVLPLRLQPQIFVRSTKLSTR
jgi:hypothetical protein